MHIKIDFDKVTGKIKPMNAVCCGPKTGGYYLRQDATAEFKDLHVPYVRLHDIEYPSGGNQFVDVHCIFPDFDADVDDEKSYNFKPTDNYLSAIREAGAQVFFRLGESIDHFENKLFVRPPKDNLKWAKICEHIIRHYNYGWAMGFYMEIEHWEIWNEPEGHAQWTGRFEEFIELYTVTSKYLKQCYPTLKIGGYSAFGFYTETSAGTHPDIIRTPIFRTIIPKMNRFFQEIKENGAPLDFFSWHCYAHSPEEIGESARYIRKYLDDNGYEKTESYLTEYNAFYCLSKNPATNPHYVSELLASLIVGEDSPLDACYYYAMFKNSIYNGLFDYNVLTGKCVKLPAYNSMKFFGDLYGLSDKVATDYDRDNGVYCLAAKNENNKSAAISVTDYEGLIKIEIQGAGENVVNITSVDGMGRKNKFILSRETDGFVNLPVQKNSIYFLSCEE